MALPTKATLKLLPEETRACFAASVGLATWGIWDWLTGNRHEMLWLFEYSLGAIILGRLVSLNPSPPKAPEE